MADGGTAEWQKGYIPNLPDIFTVHADNDDTLLIIYSIDKPRGALPQGQFYLI